ncbi:hypothetical protein PSV09DRAFT_2262667 [Bipolaris maydis]|uniref:uncharacterized protein n=1 Tax=Cochliobolus heterostrophus TaxID=5016 RepID=UPI0024D85879|nr:hypothetical protein J3E73DRAFT_255924 [Bipolaris maydis]KAJ5062782.1 hypothetical protein J3E74DRAFT_472983 [Bipolaris maydis]KAJ6204956.1 hypothetical protein PSV09DRAFT_2262667 [Bipolaris maydis]KAJ6265374.1 hypothetical protein PSV08DRAFT_252770 [Bipolaris maydis]KAJ6283315.1 hypothetical protein J3E71DRAFT_239437 [Bipolaris maydis]
MPSRNRRPSAALDISLGGWWWIGLLSTGRRRAGRLAAESPGEDCCSGERGSLKCGPSLCDVQQRGRAGWSEGGWCSCAVVGTRFLGVVSRQGRRWSSGLRRQSQRATGGLRLGAQQRFRHAVSAGCTSRLGWLLFHPRSGLTLTYTLALTLDTRSRADRRAGEMTRCGAAETRQRQAYPLSYPLTRSRGGLERSLPGDRRRRSGGCPPGDRAGSRNALRRASWTSTGGSSSSSGGAGHGCGWMAGCRMRGDQDQAAASFFHRRTAVAVSKYTDVHAMGGR